MPGQKGNFNALKHGLYSRHFPKDVLTAVKKMPVDQLIQEIASSRLVISKILDDFKKADAIAYSAAISSLVTCMRTHAMLTGNYTPLNDSIEEALDDVTAYTNPEPQS